MSVEENKWDKIDARIDYIYHECSKEDVDKFPPHFHRYKIRLIDDPDDADSIIHWWSLFDGSSDHHILCCCYCGAVLS